MKTSPPALLPLLRSGVQARLLAEILLNPDREPSLSELADSLGTSLPTVGREVRRGEQAGLVSTRTIGRTRLVRAATSSPLYPPLRELLSLTFGAPAVLAEEFGGVESIQAMYVFGSWAARYAGQAGPEPADIDVILIGNPDRDDAYEAAERAETRLRRPVQTTIRTPEQWDDPGDPFLRHVRSRPLVPVPIDGDRAA